MLAALTPIEASAGAAGCWVQYLRRRAPETLALSCLRRLLVAVLRILGVRSSPSNTKVRVVRLHWRR